MKNTIKLFGIIALVAVIGFSMAACGDPGDDPGDDVLEGDPKVPAAYIGTSWEDPGISTYKFTSDTKMTRTLVNGTVYDYTATKKITAGSGYNVGIEFDAGSSGLRSMSFKSDGSGVGLLSFSNSYTALVKIEETSIVGTWVGSASGNDLQYIFNDDGTYEYSAVNEYMSEPIVFPGTYTITGNTLTLTFEAYDTTNVAPYSFSISTDGKTLTLEREGIDPLTFTKQ